MFGYISPCKMELKIKDYEKFKAYYCGVCRAIKNKFGNIPRLTLNYDMTFLAILLDSLDSTKVQYIKTKCIVHPLQNKVIIVNNKSLDYAAFCNIALAYYKLIDDFKDDKSIKAKILALFLNKYLKNIPKDLKNIVYYINKKIDELSYMEKNFQNENLDKISHPFAELTGFIISSYFKSEDFKLDLYWLGYNLGKWIYIIDAYDDLEKDMANNKFNPIDKILNTDNLPYSCLKLNIKDRIEFILYSCARESYEYFLRLPITRNQELLENILHYGLVEKMNLILKRGELKNEKSL